MTIYDVTIAKLRQMPEPLAQEVNDFIEGIEIAESDFADYLHNLENYENHLACGEIQW
jgi:hypothetical protein